MRRLVITLASILAINVVFAGTEKYSVEDFIHVRSEGTEAREVYSSFDLPEEQLSEGKGKSFMTSDRVVTLECFNRHYNVEPYACHFIFDMRGLSQTTVIKSERNGLRFVLSSKDSQILERILLPKEPLEIDGGQFVISCLENEDSSCSVFLAL